MCYFACLAEALYSMLSVSDGQNLQKFPSSCTLSFQDGTSRWSSSSTFLQRIGLVY